ncbi:hypothetical protein Pure05_41990 [Paenarthrobacter ureafaciens]|nr:hypothetical protein Pure01_42010 [Paenarthrobacter ureafaciens]GLU65967.1 hypothetical protein Pure02_42170 [Paenarthrobacter ureafaciens]GLU70257.1 hypothetical protein Pure03_42330 [Paenarthrobacter ureafaciens]GLU74508.1 hypothetical protein Pure04_42230 [Paenarthrobacter ureafaciens]GLU78759.1 hypothetical protein Pure05_41990 [Paenarthrobacter ureafaciens]
MQAARLPQRVNVATQVLVIRRTGTDAQHGHLHGDARKLRRVTGLRGSHASHYALRMGTLVGLQDTNFDVRLHVQQ